MRFGVFSTLESVSGDCEKDYREFLDQCVYAEELAYDNVWLAEHHGSNYGTVPRTQLMAAAVAQRTERIGIGSLVTNLPFSNPVRVAEDWAMVDVLSGGRVSLGVGRGYQPAEFALMQADPNVSREMFAESLDVLLGLWRNERFTFHGRYFHLDDAEIFPRPVQVPHPPVWVGALSPESFQLVTRHNLNLAVQPTLMTMPMLEDQVVSAARLLIEHGRDPESIDFPLQMMVHIAETKKEAQAAAAEPVNWFFDKVLTKVPGGSGPAAKSYEFYKLVADQLSGAVSMEMLDAAGIVLITDPDGARETLTQLRDDIGVKQFSCWMRFGGMADEQVRSSMRLMAEEVMPHLREDTPTPLAFVAEEPPTFDPGAA